jgi:NADPH-dependent 2,4-dienoyl-CoA reductase/sulfur reductase-like enzyme/peroxiredoxin family protein/TusA-related sulfurtransferase/rhodanese-related sulfurtransferase
MKVCIVGGVAGGASAAARLRRLNEKAQIIIFEKGEYISFANCGLPYHLSGKIRERERLLLQTPAAFKQRFNVEVRTFHQVRAVDRQNKKLTVLNTRTGESMQESYDYLILSPGAFPIVPDFPGKDSRLVFTLRDIPDMDRIINQLRSLGKGRLIQRAVVVGGGFIGVEVAENLHQAGIETHLVELAPQIMAPFDPEMASLLQQKMQQQGIILHLKDSLESLVEVDRQNARLQLRSGELLDAQLCILGIGVRPQVELARVAGLELGPLGGIKVSSSMQTNDPAIYAVGDVIEVTNPITHGPALIPLAGPANRQGRIAADNIAGIKSEYSGTIGTSIVKVFELQAAATGINEKTAQQKNIPYQAIYLFPNNHAGYYPGATPITFKVLFHRHSGAVLGAQAIGREGVDKRIDIMAVAIQQKMRIEELAQLELCYAPPYGSAKDPINMAGFIGSNIRAGRMAVITPQELEKRTDKILLDVRTPTEYEMGHIEGALNIPVDHLREKAAQIPGIFQNEKSVIVYCQVGFRGYLASQILQQLGHKNILNLTGGYKAYSLFYPSQQNIPTPEKSSCQSEYGDCSTKNVPGDSLAADEAVDETLDATGLQCPGPIMQLRERLENLEVGKKLEVLASDAGFVKDVGAFCQVTGHKLLGVAETQGVYRAVVEKILAQKQENLETTVIGSNMQNKKTIVVFSNDFDRAMASFIIANGARAMGSEVVLFFTFWGLNLLRRSSKVKVQKNILEKMFGMMMPRGPSKTKLSKMNMLGMGTAMMKFVMGKKNVAPLSELIEQAQKSGIKLVACSMTMDVMGIKKTELIEGVEIGGVAQYLSEAQQSNMNLFI